MIILDDLNRAFNVLFKTRTATFRVMKIPESFAFFYKYSLLPLILVIIMSYALNYNIIGRIAGITNYGPIAESLVLLWILVPIGIFVFSIFIYIIGKILKMASGEFSKTMSAAVYGAVPFTIFSWLTSILAIHLIVAGVLALWGFAILVVALSEQHGVRILQALIVSLVSLIVLALIFYAGAYLMHMPIRL